MDDETKACISADRAYLAGMKAGWNYGVSDDKAGYMQVQAGMQKEIHDAIAEDAEKLSSMNDALCDFASRWVYDGDYLRCKKCKRPHIASKADMKFVHVSGCKAEETAEDYPWKVLIRILRPLTTKPIGAGAEASSDE